MPKAGKKVEFKNQRIKVHFVASLPAGKVDSELTKQGQTYTWNNQASNGKDKTSTIKYHTDKPTIPAKPSLRSTHQLRFMRLRKLPMIGVTYN